MRIAFFIDTTGNISTIQNSYEIFVYAKDSTSWTIIQTIPTDLDPSMDLSILRTTITQIINELSPCNIIIAEKMIGLAYNLFNNADFHIWEYEGTPITHLSAIEQNELVIRYDLNSDNDPFSYFETLEDGRYNIDVKSILFNDPQISSKKLLIPFLDHHPFYELQITFSHIPPWLPQDLESRNMEMQIIMNKRDRYVVVVRAKTCSS